MTASPDPATPNSVPRRGNRFSRWLGRSVLSLMGWRIEGELPAEPKLVAVGAPHTSNWDFVFMLATVCALGLKLSWLGKDSLFKPPFCGRFMRWVGGVAIDRSAAQNVVEQSIEKFANQAQLLLCIAPEGTRGKVTHWKTGFYRIAHGAGVPIMLCYLDYKKKVAGIGPTIIPTGDLEKQLAEIQAFYETVTGRHPHLHTSTD